MTSETTPSRALHLASVAAAVAIAAAAALTLTGRRRRARAADPARIEHLEDATYVNPDTGAVHSVQKADLTIDEAALDAIWTPTHLERLARTYWRFLTRVTLGLIQIRYGEDERSVVLVFSALKLLTFRAPEYEMDSERGLVRWRIARGVLVSRRGRGKDGYLQIAVRRSASELPRQARLHVEVAVENFYPAIASAISLRLYNATQSRIHVIITYGFLRSLTRLDLAESRVGRLRAAGQPRES